MTDNYSILQPRWLERFKRESVIRKAVVISGNTNDIFPYRGRYLTVPHILQSELDQNGYIAVQWDQVQGIINLTTDQISQLVQHTVNAFTTNQSNHATDGNTSQDYDLGEAEYNTPTTSNTEVLPTRMNIEDYLALVLDRMTDNTQLDRPYAFVIDYSHLLFGDNRSLSENERPYLVQLAKALRDSPVPQNSIDLTRTGNMVVFICRHDNSLPSALVIDNPVVGNVYLQRPSRSSRQSFLEHCLDMFDTMPPITPGSRKFTDFVDAQDGFCYRDCLQLAALSRNQLSPLSPDKLVNLYKYGEKNSPWEELNRDKLLKCADELKNRVVGQEYAVDRVYKMLIKAYSGLSGIQHSSQQSTPKGILFFVGPTGVGKTELAKALANFLFGDDSACIRFDMSEFNHEHSDQRLVGAPPGYVGYEQGGQLTNAVKAKPFSVILFDEIEKAHGKILDKFLQILEDGRLTDGKGETVSFSETIIIFTSNIGASEVDSALSDNESADRFINAVRSHFTNELKRPELLGRIGANIVPFNFIKDNDFQIKIARAKFEPLKKRLKQKYNIANFEFANEEKALQTLCKETDISKGGRAILNVIDQFIINPLSLFLVENVSDEVWIENKTIVVFQVGDTCRFEFNLK